MRVLRICLVVVFGLLLVTGVGCKPGKLEVILYYPQGEDGQELFKKVSEFEISLSGQAIPSDGERTRFSVDSPSPSLPNVGCAKEKGNLQMEVRVLGIGEGDKTVAAGRQVVFHPCGQPRQIHIFISPIEAFSSLSSYTEGSTKLGRLVNVRAGHRVTYLPDGRLFISGGGIMNGPGKFSTIVKNTEIFNPETGEFTSGPDLSTARAFHSATLIGNKVFIAGGIQLKAEQNDQFAALKSIDIFEIGENGKLTRIQGSELTEARAFHTAMVTPNEGNVFLFGGMVWREGEPPKMNSRWEIFTPTGEEAGKGEIANENRRAWHTAVLMTNERALIAGGLSMDAQGGIVGLDSMISVQFLGGDKSITVTSLGKMKQARAAHTAVVLPDAQGARILLTGGMIPDGTDFFKPKTVHNSMELLAANGSFETQLQMQQARVFHSSTLLEDGRVLVFGGFTGTTMANTAEIFRADDQTGLKPASVTIPQRKDRFYHSATLLNNGSLLILGGVSTDPQQGYVTLYRAELFNPRPPSK